jgi:hypothetical protein
MKKLMLFFIISLHLTGYGQLIQFTKDSIPLAGEKIIFRVDFKFDLSKEEFHKRAFSYLNDAMNPYSGGFTTNNNDYTLCRITDYINFSDNLFETFGMYMTYNLQLGYRDSSCTMIIRDINYMEKGYFETQEKSKRKLNMPEYSGEDIMIKKNYSLMLKKNASGRITDASLNRINEIIKGLDYAFRKE